MKTKRTLILLALLVVLCGHEAQAFYNASAGRWLSRDPIEESGGLPLYAFVSNRPVSESDLLGLVIEAACGSIDDYLNSLGIAFKRTGTIYSFAGTDLGSGDANAKMIVSRMLFVGTVFKLSSAGGSETDNLKKHIEARLTIIRNALKANFLFGTGNKVDWTGFSDDPQAFFDKLNNGKTVIACTALSRILFETGNRFAPQGVRTRTRGTPANLVWIPGDWGWIENKGVVSEPGYEGENVFHTGKSAKGEMFWGHFKPGVHPSMSESEWFDFIRNWPGGGKPEWREKVKYTTVGLERPTDPNQ